ncbi:acyl-CoA N-acyltransferase [Cyathus striatus]|nr:acyl-CoA N-acyltransferase [Cyathus striatus]
MFTTERLVLRAYKETDVDNVLDLFNNPEVTAYLNHDEFNVPRGPKFAENIMKMTESCLMFCVVEEKQGRSFAGLALINHLQSAKNREASLGIALLPQFWGKGYGTEAMKFFIDYAFRTLGMHRVSLDVNNANWRAVELYKKLGFITEGVKRQSIWTDGTWTDLTFMGLIDTEWHAKRTHPVNPMSPTAIKTLHTL